MIRWKINKEIRQCLPPLSKDRYLCKTLLVLAINLAGILLSWVISIAKLSIIPYIVPRFFFSRRKLSRPTTPVTIIWLRIPILKLIWGGLKNKNNLFIKEPFIQGKRRYEIGGIESSLSKPKERGKTRGTGEGRF